jgi:stage III sporulation protein AB
MTCLDSHLKKRGDVMPLKILGAVIVFCATMTAGFYYGGLDSLRARDLMELKKALSILRAEIEFAKTPLAEVLTSIGRRVRQPIGDMFTLLLDEIDVNRGGDVAEMWERCVRSAARISYLKDEDIEQLTSFGKTLGYLDSGMQIAGISILNDYINDKVSALNKSGSKNKRMYQSLGALCGLLAIVLFI